jgi:hypothetical protein
MFGALGMGAAGTAAGTMVAALTRSSLRARRSVL